MKLLSTILAVSAVSMTSAFTSPMNTAVINRMQPSSRSGSGVFMNVEGQDGAVSSRRQALGQASGWLAAAGLAVVAVAPTMAYADPLAADNDADDVVKRIAAQSAAVNEAARAKKAKEAPKEKGDGGKSLVGLAAAGGVVLTLPFFLPNLMRIGTKLTSGGEDDGYGKKR